MQRQTRGQLVGATERTTTDRRRERRRKKKLQHDRHVTQELKEKSKAAAGVVETKETAMKRLEKKSKSEKGITLIKVSEKKGITLIKVSKKKGITLIKVSKKSSH